MAVENFRGLFTLALKHQFWNEQKTTADDGGSRIQGDSIEYLREPRSIQIGEAAGTTNDLDLPEFDPSPQVV